MKIKITPRHHHFSCYIEFKEVKLKHKLNFLILKSILSLNGISKNIPLNISNKPNTVNGESKIILSSIFDEYSNNYTVKRFSSLIDKIITEMVDEHKTFYFVFKVHYSYRNKDIKKYCWSDNYILSINVTKNNTLHLKISHIRGLRRISVEEFANTILNTLICTLKLYEIPLKDITIIKTV